MDAYCMEITTIYQQKHRDPNNNMHIIFSISIETKVLPLVKALEAKRRRLAIRPVPIIDIITVVHSSLMSN